jgi:hypothetical protein
MIVVVTTAASKTKRRVKAMFGGCGDGRCPREERRGGEGSKCKLFWCLGEFN